METRLTNDTAALRENEIKLIRETMEYKSYFGDAAGGHVSCLFDLLKDTTDALNGIISEKCDYDTANLLHQKVFQIQSLQKAIHDNVHYEILDQAEIAFEFMKRYKDEVLLGIQK